MFLYVLYVSVAVDVFVVAFSGCVALLVFVCDAFVSYVPCCC